MRRVIVIAVAGFSLGFLGRLQADAANRAGPARIGTARRRCPDVAGTGLQDTLFGCRAGSRHRFLGHLHAEQIPARDGAGAGDPYPRRFLQPRIDHARSQSGGRGTSARWSAATAGAETDEAEAAETAQGRSGAAARGIAVPRSGASTAASATAACPLITCIAWSRAMRCCRSAADRGAAGGFPPFPAPPPPDRQLLALHPSRRLWAGGMMHTL
jgi:hypothetical protein